MFSLKIKAKYNSNLHSAQQINEFEVSEKTEAPFSFDQANEALQKMHN